MYKVLIVDDEPWMLRNIQGFFGFIKEEYCIVGEAENGKDALDIAQREKPDIIISDIRMPDMDGLAFVEALRGRENKAKVILLSGYAEFEYARQALRLDVTHYLLKPLDRRELRKALDEIGDALRMEAGQETQKEPVAEEEYCEIRMIMQDIDNNYTKNLSLADLAAKYAISSSHLSGMIKEKTGMNFMEQVTKRRIDKAKQLLKNEKHSVAEVGKMVGYDDYFYFTKRFKQLMGVTPSKYRSARKENF